MPKLYETKETPQKAFLVSIITGNSNDNAMFRELEGLAKTLDIEIAAHEKIRVREKTAKFGMGSGKAEELSKKAKEMNADMLVFDWNPSPSQQRNWEELSELPVVDRQELIIRIFAQRAITREAELQVRLAELTYFLPRLTHKYIDLSRQRGGRYGTKGTGETKLETDRRKIEKQINLLEKEIDKIRNQRKTQRGQRERNNMPVCAIVGYTNAGKSSLLNALTGADVLAQDKLFCTLDAVTRRFQIAPDVTVLLTDTVGFIRSLPHSLIKAFHSTLEEAALADILIHILDASEPDIEGNYETTINVLRDLTAMKGLSANELKHAKKTDSQVEKPPIDIPMITVLNKIDRLTKTDVEELQSRFKDSVAVSVKNGIGLDTLKNKIAELI
ncbi:GTP-binding protein [Treponema sp. R8-4-B8]